MCSEAHCVLGFIFSLTGMFRASFSEDDKKLVSNKININDIRLVSMCFLGTVLRLMLVPAGHFNMFTQWGCS